MKKIAKITTVLLATNLCFPYSAVAEENNDITVYSLYPTKDSVTDFCIWLDDIDMSAADRALLRNEKNCYWIRTIPENSNGISIEDVWLMLYKDSNTGATLLGFENQVTLEDKVVRFTGNDGGLGVTSLALMDINNDGWEELYFTYSWNPGTYCSQVGYFDIETGDVHYFGDYICPDSELIFTSENDTLTVCTAELTDYEDKVHFELEADKSIAKIVCNDGEIGLEPLSDDFVKLEEKLEPAEKPLPDWLPENAGEAETFMDENGDICVKDNYISWIVYINGADSYRGNNVCVSEKSDIQSPIFCERYEDEYFGEYIVSCFEMSPDSYLDIYDGNLRNPTHYSYISDENGKISEACKGDANKDGQLNVADVVVLQKWILGDGDSLGCWQNADICDDNRIDVFDICLIKSILLKRNNK